MFGCETRETGEIFNQEADGILGLGNSPISLVNQARDDYPKTNNRVFTSSSTLMSVN